MSGNHCCQVDRSSRTMWKSSRTFDHCRGSHGIARHGLKSSCTPRKTRCRRRCSRREIATAAGKRNRLRAGKLWRLGPGTARLAAKAVCLTAWRSRAKDSSRICRARLASRAGGNARRMGPANPRVPRNDRRTSVHNHYRQAAGNLDSLELSRHERFGGFAYRPTPCGAGVQPSDALVWLNGRQAPLHNKLEGYPRVPVAKRRGWHEAILIECCRLLPARIDCWYRWTRASKRAWLNTVRLSSNPVTGAMGADRERLPQVTASIAGVRRPQLV